MNTQRHLLIIMVVAIAYLSAFTPAGAVVMPGAAPTDGACSSIGPTPDRLAPGTLIFGLGMATEPVRTGMMDVPPCFVAETGETTALNPAILTSGRFCGTEGIGWIQNLDIEGSILASENPPACMASAGLLTVGVTDDRVCKANAAQMKSGQPGFLREDEAPASVKVAG